MKELCSRIVLPSLLVALASLTAFSQTSSFSYQGHLLNAGVPGNGPYDMEFRLFDSPTGGSQVAAPAVRTNVSVADGVFSVILDFGPAAFPGGDRFLEIAVRSQGGPAPQTLSPRSQILSSPYALRARTVTGPVNGTSPAATLTVSNDQPGIKDPSPTNLPPAAIKGEATSTSNSNAGLMGIGNGSVGIGVVGITTGAGAKDGPDAIGVLGLATSPGGPTIGVSAQVASPNGTAIDASAPAGALLFKGSSEDSQLGTTFSVSAAGAVMASGPITSNGLTSMADANINGNLGVSGTVQIGNIPGGGNSPLCTLGTSANVIRFCSSSLRYKSSVTPFTGGLNIVNRLRPIRFAWTENGSADLGLGAEDVARVEPLLTLKNLNGDVEGVKYAQISVVLINAIKEQQAQIERQQALIDKLTRAVHKLTSRKRVGRAAR